MTKMLIAAALAAGVTSGAWGRSFSLDLRNARRNGAVARLVSSAPSGGLLRAFDLDAGAADVGDVAVGDELKFTLFDDVTVKLALKEKMPTPLGGDAFIAEAADYDGVKSAVVLRTVAGLVVDVQDCLRKRVYKVISSASGVKVQEMQSKGGRCGCDMLVPPARKAVRTSAAAQRMPRLQSGLERDGDVFVDILVAFDANAKAWVESEGGGMTNFAQVAVQKMNVVLSNVGLVSSFRFRLAGVMAVAAASSDFGYVLDSVAYGRDGWKAVRAMRDAVGADIAAVMIDTGSAYGVTGLGYTLERSGMDDFADWAYCACSVRSVAQSHTMTHEVGHNMGCGHSDLQQDGPGPQLYNYSSGYYFQVYNGSYYESFHTIMAYDYAGPWGDEVEVPYFSSPNYMYSGVPVGDELHDNAQTISRTFAIASRWRSGSGGGIGGNGYATVFVMVAPGCEAMGRVYGGDNAYKVGSRVSIRATAASGYAFVGWYLEGVPLAGGMDYRTPSYAYLVTGEPALIEARFASKEEDAASLALNLHDCSAKSDGTCDLDLGECVESLSLPKLAVTGLPAGLKFDANAMAIAGKATKPGVYKVKVTASNASAAGRSAVAGEFRLTVPNITSEKMPNLMPDGEAYGIVQCGVAFDPSLVDCTTEDGWTVKAAGLPAGLKWDANAGVITGVPTKAGVYTVTFTASKKGEANQTATITLVTEALPEWAQGTFAGYVAGAQDANPYCGFATMTVAASGKVSGKIALGGTNWTFSAASYAASDGGDCFEVVADAKSGKATMPLWLMVSSAAAPESGGTQLLNAVGEGWLGDSGTADVSLWRNVWKDKSTAAAAKAEMARWEGVYTVSAEDGGYLSLALGRNGDVKAAGKSADGTAVSATAPLMYQEGRDFFTVVCAAPSAYKGGFAWLPIGFGAERGPLLDLGPGMVLCSRNPQATGEYGAGFTRHLAFDGGYYDKGKKLSDYYEALRLSIGAPEFVAAYKLTTLDENGRKVTETWSTTPDAVDAFGQDGMTVAVNEKGQFVVAKATKPVQDKKTKAWAYNGPNDGALALSFAQATGIFRGSYTFWYDYTSAYDETTGKATMAHVSKKVSFEGMVVQGAGNMRGFYLWDAAGSYDDPKTGRPKTYKYKESRLALLSEESP